jgi:hypothetical protein
LKPTLMNASTAALQRFALLALIVLLPFNSVPWLGIETRAS